MPLRAACIIFHFLLRTTPLTHGRGPLTEHTECPLLGHIAERPQTLERLQAGRVLPLRNNTTLLRLHQVLPHQTPRRLRRSSVPNLRM